MARRAIRRARELRDEWVRRLCEGVTTAPRGFTPSSSGRGGDYRDAPQLWVCNRKKAYPSEEIARSVAARLNEANEDEETARPGFFGVVVNPYACGRCGAWHLGR